MGLVMNNLSQLNYGLTARIGGLLCVFRNFDVGGLTVFLGFRGNFPDRSTSFPCRLETYFRRWQARSACLQCWMRNRRRQMRRMRFRSRRSAVRWCFDHVTFGYEPGQVILKDISALCEAGTEDRLCRLDGSRKTTITNLINRFMIYRAARSRWTASMSAGCTGRSCGKISRWFCRIRIFYRHGTGKYSIRAAGCHG